jgi:hypothetical protein
MAVGEGMVEEMGAGVPVLGAQPKNIAKQACKQSAYERNFINRAFKRNN